MFRRNNLAGREIQTFLILIICVPHLAAPSPHHRLRHQLHNNHMTGTHQQNHHHSSVKPETSEDPPSERISIEKARIPTYLKLLYEQILESEMNSASDQDNGASDVKPFETLFRAIVPSAISHRSRGNTLLHFQLDPSNLETDTGFLEVKFVFTFIPHIHRELLALEFSGNTFNNGSINNSINGTVLMDTEQRQRFYSVPITGLLQRNYGDSTLSLIHLDIQIKPLFLNSSNFAPFDLGNELPFLFIQFEQLPRMNRKILHSRQRSRRSENSRNTRQVQDFQAEGILPPQRNFVQYNGLAGAESASLSSSQRGEEDDSEKTKIVKGQDVSPEYNIAQGQQQPGSSQTTSSIDFCQRRTWLVDAHEIGLHNAINTGKLDLGYCAGECPYPIMDGRYNFTQHAFFLDRHRMFKSLTELPDKFPRPCCIPISFKKMPVLEQEGGNSIVEKSYTQAIVDSCGCR